MNVDYTAITEALDRAFTPKFTDADEAIVNALLVLKEEVNKSRYRGPQRNEPMEDQYHWPMNGFEEERICAAALAFIVAVEKVSKEPKTAKVK